jgi:cytochrome c oxidase subunit 1
MFIGFNLTFGPFHVLGLQGMPRRIYTYPDGMGWNFWNMISTVGAFVIALSILVFIWNAARSRKKGEIALADPWDARTLEWATSSPPPEHNFDEIPVVERRDDFWYRKYTDHEGHPVPIHAGGADAEEEHEGTPHGIHMPDPSYWPVVGALALPVMGYGVVYSNWPVLIGGGFLLLLGMFGWAFEPSAEEGGH